VPYEDLVAAARDANAEVLHHLQQHGKGRESGE